MQHIIIGSGPAGVVAAETIRRHDPKASVMLIGDEPEPPYSRMAIPYLLIDRIGEAGTYLRKSEDYYDDHRIDVRVGRVGSVDGNARTVRLDNGESLSFDRLLIATGSRPVQPPIDGMDLPGVHPCWTLEDARHIMARARPGSSVVLMGAGFIGCIILEALAGRGVNLTVVEMENRMVPRMMNDRSGGLIKRWCEQKGVNVLTSTRVEGIARGEGERLDVSLANGDRLQADLVISATGVRANTEFLDGSGIACDQGVLVDHRLRTSVADVYAAGDVAQGKDFSSGGYSVQAIQPTAVEHGRIAAVNMVDGQEIVHRGSLNMNVLDTMGLVSSSFGAWDGVDGGDSAELSDPDGFRYLNLQFRDDVLVGANSLGLTQHVGVLRGLIQTELSLGPWKERLKNNPLAVMEAYIGATQGVGLTSKAL
jgi:NAD(P)H-nitrite reductase large subunit